MKYFRGSVNPVCRFMYANADLVILTTPTHRFRLLQENYRGIVNQAKPLLSVDVRKYHRDNVEQPQLYFLVDLQKYYNSNAILSTPSFRYIYQDTTAVIFIKPTGRF